MKNKICRGLFAVALIITAALLNAPEKALASADISYIQSNASAAAAGMGGAYSTATEDSGAMHYNPACLYGLRQVEIAASSSKGDFGQKYDSFNYAFLNGYKKRAYGGVTYIKDEIGGIEGRDKSGNFTKMFSDKAQLFGYSMGSTNNYLKKSGISYGFTAKYLSHEILNSEASGFGLDVGLLKEEKDGRRFGLAVKNIAGSVKWKGGLTNPSERLDRILSAGFSLKCLKNGRLAAEITSAPSSAKKVITSFGFEKSVSAKARVRLGLSDGNMSYGAGFLLNQSKVDYAFVRTDYDDIHRIGATFYLDDDRRK